MNREVEDGMGFSGLAPTADERRRDVYEDTRRKIAQAREQQIAKLAAENKALREAGAVEVEQLRAIIQEALDAAPGHDAEKFMLMPHALAESGWFNRACAALNIQQRQSEGGA